MPGKSIDELVTATTAFRSADALLAAIDDDGYVPSLRHDRTDPRALGEHLEAMGRRVFWMENLFSYF